MIYRGNAKPEHRFTAEPCGCIWHGVALDEHRLKTIEKMFYCEAAPPSYHFLILVTYSNDHARGIPWQ